MSPWQYVIIAIAAVLVVGMAFYALRREEPPVPAVSIEPVDEDLTVQHEALDALGAELLERRIELDARRGALSGESQVYDAFLKLEERLQSGEIGEEEFEREKVRLLGGEA